MRIQSFVGRHERFSVCDMLVELRPAELIDEPSIASLPAGVDRGRRSDHRSGLNAAPADVAIERGKHVAVENWSFLFKRVV